MPPVVDPRKQQRYAKLRQEGWPRASACREVGVSESWAIKFDKGHWDNGDGYAEAKAEAALPLPRKFDDLCAEAKRGLEDFGFFRRYYLGHVSTPWQVETANRLVELRESPHKEFTVINTAPGGGKSTLVTDIATWATCRDRSIRGLMGSRKGVNARRQVVRVKRNLERPKPYKAPTEEIERGLAVDAQAALAAHYGLFKPVTHSDVWRAEEFVVAQLDDVPIEEKEPTWSSYGRDGGVLGNRFDLIFWDDLVDRTNTRTFEVQRDVEEWWDEEAETRLEPRGLLVLIGQRMHATDLYHFCINKTLRADDDDGEEEQGEPAAPAGGTDRMYTHIVYPAHFDEVCTGVHRPSEAKPWPDGCLLDPYRLPWRDLKKIRDTKPQRYEVLYQQRDGDASSLFIKDVWLSGGVDPDDGSLLPGCYDEDRGLCELPAGLVGPKISVATVDPSVVNMWAVQWWIYTPEASHQVFLMDLLNQSMPANDLLDWNANTQEFYGVMEQWQQRSHDLGLPITHWVCEANAAHRYLLAYDHMRRWTAKWKVNVVPHTTSRTKLDPEIGPDIIRDHFRFGRVRLPRSQRGETRIQTNKLIDQLRNYRNMRYDDQVDACWFLFAHLPNLTVQGDPNVRLRRPRFLGLRRPA
jgi:hypothetical protein